jgi:shikimate dehydrogenase
VKFGVVGYPVSHSRSPVMHMAGYRHFGIDAVYELLETPPGGFAGVVSALRDQTLDGVNVTMPHKHNAFAAADIVDETVRRLGAVNTMVVHNGELAGINTDIDGVLHAISRLELPPDMPAHVLGSGGAAAAAIVAAERTRQVSVSARSEQRITDLLRQLGSEASVFPWGTPPDGAIVINATSLGMHAEWLPAGVVEGAAGFVDMPYGEAVTPSVRAAERLDIPYADGLVMLAGQAAEAFRVFTGQRVPADVMETAARSR